MKERFLVLLVSAALTSFTLSASAQTTPQSTLAPAPRVASGKTVVVQGTDGQTHEFELPTTMSIRTITPADLTDLQRTSDSQNGCPVHIVKASFERPGQLMLTSRSAAMAAPTLHLNYKNSSGKDIQSVELTGWIKVQENPYQLDSVNYPFDLVLSRKALLGKDVEASQALKLADDAIGFDRVELSRVTYTDGTSWKPRSEACTYRATGNIEQAAR